MVQGIEIYVRPSGERVLLNLYIPAGARAASFKSLEQGTLDASTVPIALELSVLPEWATDPEARARIVEELGSIHARIPIAAVNVQFTD